MLILSGAEGDRIFELKIFTNYKYLDIQFRISLVRRLFCVGVGPGDPKLLTIKGKEIIETSEVIFSPVKSVQSESFALETIKKIIKLEDKEIYPLLFPMTTNEEKLKPYWEKAYEKIREKIFEGKNCVFIVEGDPLIYSTFNNILEIIKKKQEFDVEIIPGISSFQAMSASLKIPVVDGDEVLVIASASYKESSGCRTAKLRDDFQKILNISDTIFLMKAGRVVSQILQNKNGFLTFFGELCGTESEFISELKPELQDRKNHYFSTILMKKQN